MAAPITPERAGQHPEEPVTRAEPRPLPGGAGQDRELLAQEEVLRHQIAVATQGRLEERHQEQQVLEHVPA